MSEKEFAMIFAKNLCNYMESNNVSQADLARHMNVSTASVNYWCKGIKTPRMDKVDKICSMFGISRSDLIEEHTDNYYADKESEELAQFLFDNPNYKVLFDASRKVKPEDIQKVADMIEIMTRK